MVERDQHGRAREEPSSNNLDFCLFDDCLAELTHVEASYEDLTLRYECADGHSGAKCLTELATSDI